MNSKRDERSRKPPKPISANRQKGAPSPPPLPKKIRGSEDPETIEPSHDPPETWNGGQVPSTVCPTFGRILQLAYELRTNVLDPARNLLKEIDLEYNEEIRKIDQECQTELTKANSEFGQIDEKSKKERQSAVDKCENSLRRIENEFAAVKSHLRKFGFGSDEFTLENSSGNSPDSLGLSDQPLHERIEKGQQAAKRIENIANQAILSKSHPKYFYRPTGDGAWGGLAFASLCVGVWFLGSFGSFSVFLITSIGFYWGCLLAPRLLTVLGLRSALTNLIPQIDRTRSLLKECVKEARNHEKDSVLQADARLRIKTEEEKEKARNLKDSSREFRDSKVEQLNNELFPRLEHMHFRFDEFLDENSFFAGEWDHQDWMTWNPTELTDLMPRFGKMEVLASDLKDRFPDLNFEFSLPAVAPLLEGRSLLLKPEASKAESASSAVQAAITRLLATTAPGMLRFTFIDPVSLGTNVAAFMDLANYEEALIQSRAWSEPQHIEKRLGELTEHMETVIQKYLRTEFDSIHEYNEAAKEVAEPYRIVVVFDFPVNFTETAARRLLSIVRNGAKCGVFALIVVDKSKELPYGFSLSEIEREVIVIDETEKPLFPGRNLFRELKRWSLRFDDPAPKAVLDRIISGFGEVSQESMRVEVPFEKLLSLADCGDENHWSGTTADSILVPLGPTGARKVQYLTLGRGTGHHALIVGRPGSGKSNLLHVIITSIALIYEPKEIRLFLIDFKKGVEFKPYAVGKLPHAEAIAVESEREFGLSVLERLNEELTERGELFRSFGAVEISEFRAKSGQTLPRLLLLVDEFQEFFTEDDFIARETNRFLDRLVRQGRAFGIHIILASQNLPRTHNLSESTLDQMAIRIAMQCSEADSRRILADDNPAARLLSRPGEAIYNSASGLVEGNQIFQVALLSEENRLRQIELVGRLTHENNADDFVPIIFEGNEVTSLSDCGLINDVMEKDQWEERPSAEFLLGEPVAIRSPITAKVRRQSGCHLLVLSRDEEEGVSVCSSAILGVLASQSPEHARFFVANFSLAETEFAEGVDAFESSFSHDFRMIRRQSDLAALVKDIADEVSRRLNTKQEPTSLYLVLLGIQRMRRLRSEDSWKEHVEQTPSEHLEIILRDGPEVGVHVIGWCDTFSNASRVVDRRMMDEFGLRAGGVMSTDESQSFFDDSAASKIDKPHRFLFFDQEKPGRLEKFRPYAIPEKAWFEKSGKLLSRRNS